MAEGDLGVALTGEAEVAATFGFKTGEVGFSDGVRWTLGFVWDEDALPALEWPAPRGKEKVTAAPWH
jgi:hypothetical protein